MEGTIFRDI